MFSFSKSFDYLTDQRIRLAVTGLSKSGKTTFITSMINALLNAHQDYPNHLMYFSPKQKGYIQVCDIIEQNDLDLEAFPYGANMKALSSDPPQWPKATDSLSQITLQIKIRTDKGLWDKLSSGTISNTQVLKIDIFDYPGEWLLDLGLLDKDFKQWSWDTYKMMQEGSRKELAKDFLAAYHSVNLKEKVDYSTLSMLARKYKDYLLACKEKGLEFLQPGRFVLSPDSTSPLLEFFPLIADSEKEMEALYSLCKKNNDSYLHCMYNRYQGYKQQYVENFYDKYFKRFDRQVILVDCLTPLNYTREAFYDTKAALREIFNHFNYGNRSLLARLFAPKIDKVAFVATKQDHITTNQVDNLQQLLKNLVDDVERKSILKGVETSFNTIAAVKASEQAQRTAHGETIQIIKGYSLESHKDVILFPGIIPNHIPDEEFWRIDNKYVFETFRPLPLTAQGLIQNINVDQLLEFLLADKLS